MCAPVAGRECEVWEHKNHPQLVSGTIVPMDPHMHGVHPSSSYVSPFCAEKNFRCADIVIQYSSKKKLFTTPGGGGFVGVSTLGLPQARGLRKPG